MADDEEPRMFDDDAPPADEAPKRRGRPPGSKTKPKDDTPPRGAGGKFQSKTTSDAALRKALHDVHVLIGMGLGTVAPATGMRMVMDADGIADGYMTAAAADPNFRAKLESVLRKGKYAAIASAYSGVAMTAFGELFSRNAGGENADAQVFDFTAPHAASGAEGGQ